MIRLKAATAIFQLRERPGPAAANRRRIKKISFWLAAVCLIGSIFVLSLEVALRAFNPLGVKQRASWHFLLWEGMRISADPEQVWEHVPGYARELLGYRVEINRFGMRGADPAETRPDVRILALGDSMTFGMSGDQQDSYPELLAPLLRRDYPDKHIEVLNGGVLGYNTLQAEAFAKRLFPALEPDIMILWWFHNDVTLTGTANPSSQEQQALELIGIRPRSTQRDLLHACYELLPCTMALLRTALIAYGEGDRSRFRFDPQSNPAGWRANRESLNRIIDFVRERNKSMLVYTFGEYPEIQAICGERGVPYVTSVRRAGREHEAQYAIHPADPHFNRAGNLLVAETLSRALQPLLRAQHAPKEFNR